MKEKGEKEKEGGEEDSNKDEESVGGADGEDKEGEDQKEQVINFMYLRAILCTFQISVDFYYVP